MGLTYDETVDIMYVKKTAGSTVGYTLPPRQNEINDNNLMIKSLLPNKVKVKVTFDDIRVTSKVLINKKSLLKSHFFGQNMVYPNHTQEFHAISEDSFK